MGMEDAGSDVGGSRANPWRRDCSKEESGKTINCFRCSGRGLAMANESAVQKPETKSLTGETPLEDLPRKAYSYLTFLRECSLILPGTSQAILGQG
jgi:hypothetical protein